MTVSYGSGNIYASAINFWALGRGKTREKESLLGCLQFVDSLSPPVRVFTNRALQNLRELPTRGTR